MRHSTLRAVAAFAASLTLTLMTLVFATPAEAQLRQAAEKLEFSMRAVGFDATTARAAGNEIITQPDGTQALRNVESGSIVATLIPGSGLGNCGTSYVIIDDDPSPGIYNVTTGFNVTDSAISYAWKVTVEGPSMVDEHVWNGTLALRTEWDGVTTGDVISRGEYHTAEVSPSESWALLHTGVICSSVGPSDADYIY